MTAFIWDLDGTLLDSYKVILESVLAALREEGVELDPSDTYKKLIAGSVKSFLSEISPEPDRLWARYRILSTARDDEIALMEGAAETLEALNEMGASNFVYTHKGGTAKAVLGRLGVLRYFADILSAEDGYPRKPAPDGVNALVRRHRLDRRKTFYVGDRPLDMECAGNAGIPGILFLPPGSPAVPAGRETYIVRDLRDIPKIASKLPATEG